MASIDIGIKEKDRRPIADGLGRLLADTYTLYLKTHNFHWNVTGPMFNTLHLMFEVQYNELWLAVDLIAERIRALGHLAPASFGDYAKRSVVESKDTIASADAMVAALVKDNEAVARRMRDAVAIADKADDVFTADMLTARVGKHEQNVWMLRAILS